MLVYVGKFAHMVLGYVTASLAASAFLNLVFLGSVGLDAQEARLVATGGSLVFSIPFVALFVAYFAFVPAIVAMLLAELLGKRDWLFYALAGAAVALAVVGFVYQTHDPLLDLDVALVPLSMIGSGLVGGIAYWFVTGRFAGEWRADTPTSPAP